MENRNRFYELDSLRGLAALTVLFSHFMLVYNFNFEETYSSGLNLNWYKYTPLHFFWAGGEAVILFFVLSGFVLFLPFSINKEFSYRNYILKRVYRIYPASIVALLLASLLFYFTQKSLEVVNSKWINGLWTNGISLKSLLSDIFLIGYSKPELNPVIWSLVHEVRLSFLFPLIAFFVIRCNFKVIFLSSILISLLGFILVKVFDSSTTSVYSTIQYSGAFFIGASLSKYRNYLLDKIKKINIYQKLSLFLIGLILYTFNWIINKDLIIHNNFVIEWSVTYGASIFILLSISSSRISNLLNKKFFRFWGEISYSLYLYHIMFLILFIKLNLNLPLILVLFFVFITSTIFAYLSYKYIEIPSIKLGKKRIIRKKEEYVDKVI